MVMWLALIAGMLVGPGLTLGIIRKVKARMQNRIGAPVWQPLLDLWKLLRKHETLSDSASWIFRFAAAFNVAAVVYLAFLVPWVEPRPSGGHADLFLVLYVLVAMRFFTLLAALDTGSSFGAFAASREATLSFLTEPASILSLGALAVISQSADLNVIFSPANAAATSYPALWLLCGGALLLASLVELSRMPIDDPTTHLELTMVHEALILEASGKNLALFEFGHCMKMMLLFGLCGQCFLHAIPAFYTASAAMQATSGVAAIVAVAVAVGMLESLAVKLYWRKAPEFIAYALTLAFIAALIAVGGKLL